MRFRSPTSRLVLAILVVALVLLAVVGAQRPAAREPAAASALAPAAKQTPALAVKPTGCEPTDQDRYVYNPGRLIVRASCLRVSGVIDAIRQEADGDLHILLRLDSAYLPYLTPANQGEELGDLVVEPICVHPVSQADAIASRAGDPDPLQNLPHTGDRVWMEGRYVLDSNHGDWAELHPLYRWGTGVTTVAPGPTPVPTPIVGSGLPVRFTTVPSPAPISRSFPRSGSARWRSTSSVAKCEPVTRWCT